MTTTLLFKTDKSLKEAAQALLEEMGITMTEFLNASLRKLVRERTMTFTVPPKSRERKRK